MTSYLMHGSTVKRLLQLVLNRCCMVISASWAKQLVASSLLFSTKIPGSSYLSISLDDKFQFKLCLYYVILSFSREAPLKSHRSSSLHSPLSALLQHSLHTLPHPRFTQKRLPQQPYLFFSLPFHRVQLALEADGDGAGAAVGVVAGQGVEESVIFW